MLGWRKFPVDVDGMGKMGRHLHAPWNDQYVYILYIIYIPFFNHLVLLGKDSVLGLQKYTEVTEGDTMN